MLANPYHIHVDDDGVTWGMKKDYKEHGYTFRTAPLVKLHDPNYVPQYPNPENSKELWEQELKRDPMYAWTDVLSEAALIAVVFLIAACILVAVL